MKLENTKEGVCESALLEENTISTEGNWSIHSTLDTGRHENLKGK